MKITRSTSTSDEYEILDEKNRKNLSACYSWTCHALFAISCIVIIWFIDVENSRRCHFTMHLCDAVNMSLLRSKVSNRNATADKAPPIMLAPRSVYNGSQAILLYVLRMKSFNSATLLAYRQ